MENNDVLRHRQEGQEVQLRAGERKANPPGHPHNLGESLLKRCWEQVHDPINRSSAGVCEKKHF